MFPPSCYYNLMCFMSICYCILERLLLQIFEYFIHDLLFDDLRKYILDSLDSHWLINATVVKIFENIVMQSLPFHVSFIFELSKFTFGYNRCPILADWLDIEIHVVFTKLFHFLPEGGLHLITPHHRLNEQLSRFILLPLLFGCQF